MGKHILLLGASGTIGRATAIALCEDGHQVTCVLRTSPQDGAWAGCDVIIGDLENMGLEAGKYDAVISCIASRTGVPRDAWAVEHDLQSAILQQAIAARIPQFILLSAICVQKPLLEFQKAKLAFEEKLRTSGLTWSIVRPTAFFKSLSGQIKRVQSGKPYLLFGDGALTACKPISDAELGKYLSGCVSDVARQNKILPIGGPGPALTPRDQGNALFDALGLTPKFRKVPIGLMDAIIVGLTIAGTVSPRIAAKAELARIGRYYATESMLVLNTKTGQYDAAVTPEFGIETLQDHFAKAARGEFQDDRGAHTVF